MELRGKHKVSFSERGGMAGCLSSFHNSNAVNGSRGQCLGQHACRETHERAGLARVGFKVTWRTTQLSLPSSPQQEMSFSYSLSLFFSLFHFHSCPSFSTSSCLPTSNYAQPWLPLSSLSVGVWQRERDCLGCNPHGCVREALEGDWELVKEREQCCELAVMPESFAAVGCVQQLAVFSVATWREAYWNNTTHYKVRFRANSVWSHVPVHAL